MPSEPTTTASERVFATPELLESILLSLLRHLLPADAQTDPRSGIVLRNAEILEELIGFGRVSPRFTATITNSLPLRQALYLTPNVRTARTWSCPGFEPPAKWRITQQPYQTHEDFHLQLLIHLTKQEEAEVAHREAHWEESLRLIPVLNPMIQFKFKSYGFRFWHIAPHHNNNQYCALMIITRNDRREFKSSNATKLMSRMQLAQPPIMALKATIWEERDETKDYVGRTTEIEDSVIEPVDGKGLTLGGLHERVRAMFDRYSDVSAIKLTTL